jgi:hypothetical protein
LILEDNLENNDLSRLKDVFAKYSGQDSVYFKIIEEGKAEGNKNPFKVLKLKN